MNKYAAQALTQQASTHGRRILVVSGTGRASTDAFDYFREAATPTATRIGLGAQRIEYLSGGRVYFTSVGATAHRGVSVDTIFYDWDACGPGEDRHIADLAPCIQASLHGEIIRA